MTQERRMRVLGTEGLIPTGGPGRRTGHFNSTDLTNVVLAMGAPQPSEAAKAVRVLYGLVCKTNALTNVGIDDSSIDVSRGTILGEWIKATIERLARPDEATRLLAEFGGMNYYDSLVVTMSIDTAIASLSIPAHKHGPHRIEVFEPPERRLLETVPRHRHVNVLIDIYMLATAGRLLADTLAHHPILIPNPAPASAAEGDATEEKTKATGPASHNDLRSVPSATRAYPAIASQTTRQQGQSARKEGGKQSPPNLGRCVPQVHRQPAHIRTHLHAQWSPPNSP